MKMAQEEDKLADKQDQKDNEDDRLDDEKDRTAMARNEEAQNFLIQTCTGCKPAPSAQEKAARTRLSMKMTHNNCLVETLRHHLHPLSTTAPMKRKSKLTKRRKRKMPLVPGNNCRWQLKSSLK